MIKTIIYLISTLAVIFYSVPRIPLFSQVLAAQLFSIIWLFFAILILGAHLDHLLILDEEKKNRLNNLKKLHLRKKEQEIIQSQKYNKRAFM